MEQTNVSAPLPDPIVVGLVDLNQCNFRPRCWAICGICNQPSDFVICLRLTGTDREDLAYATWPDHYARLLAEKTRPYFGSDCELGVCFDHLEHFGVVEYTATFFEFLNIGLYPATVN